MKWIIPRGFQETGLVTVQCEVESLNSESAQVQDQGPVLLQAHKRTHIPGAFVSGVARNSALDNDMEVSGGGMSLPGRSTWESEPKTSATPFPVTYLHTH